MLYTFCLGGYDYYKYFENISSLEALRKQHKELLKLHRPDNGGNLENMQEINAEYGRLFKVLKVFSLSIKTALSPKR